MIYLVPPVPAAGGRETTREGGSGSLLRPRTQIDLRVPVLRSPTRKVTFPNARTVRHVKSAGSQSGMSSGLLTTTPNRSPIAARLAACSAAAGTGTPSGPGSCLVAVALATTVGW